MPADDPEPPALPAEEWDIEQRGETGLQRLDRNFTELMQELRVAQTGVQILFAFLLTLAFTNRFAELTSTQRAVYLVALVAAALAAALIIAPVYWHRLLFRRQRKAELVTASNRLALGGLACVLVSIGTAILLVADVAVGGRTAVLVTAMIIAFYLMFWYVLPLAIRRRDRRQAR